MDARDYLLFRGELDCPQGGWEDYAGTFSSVEEAEAALGGDNYPALWAHLVYEGQIVAAWEKDYQGPWERIPEEELTHFGR